MEDSEVTPCSKLIADELLQVKNYITGQLAVENDSINDLLSHINSASGKMIRPSLVLLAGKCCGLLKRPPSIGPARYKKRQQRLKNYEKNS